MKDILKSENLHVRYLVDSDYHDYTKLVRSSEELFKKFVSHREVSSLAICKNSDNTFIGRCGFRFNDDLVEIELFFIPLYRNQKFGQELFASLIKYCKAQYPNKTIAAITSESNHTMVHILEKFKFTNTGDLVLLKEGFQTIFTLPASEPKLA